MTGESSNVNNSIGKSSTLANRKIAMALLSLLVMGGTLVAAADLHSS